MTTLSIPSVVSKMETKLRTMPKRWLLACGIGAAVVSVAAGVGLSKTASSASLSPVPTALSPVPSVPQTAQSTFVLTPSADTLSTQSPVMAQAQNSTAQTPPSQVQESTPLALKMETQLKSLEFNKGSTELTPAAKAELDAEVAAYKAAAKVHVRGFSGNTVIAYSVRKGLAFERALRVKTYLVEQGVEAKNIRLFYQSHDHMGQPRAEVSWFVSEDAAAKDAPTKR